MAFGKGLNYVSLISSFTLKSFTKLYSFTVFAFGCIGVGFAFLINILSGHVMVVSCEYI